MARSLSLCLPLMALLGMSASASDRDHAMHDDNHEAQASSAGNESEPTKAFRSANAKMHARMNDALTGDPDVDFMQGMIPHHQGAIDMAEIVLKYGKDPETKELAEQVIKAQTAEITFMKEWLAKRGR